MRNIFHIKSSTKCGGEASLIPFFKKSKLNISIDQQSEISYSFFFTGCLCLGLPKYIETKGPTTCFTSYKLFI